MCGTGWPKGPGPSQPGYTGRAALHFYLLTTMRDVKGVIDRMHEPGADQRKVVAALKLLPRLANALLKFPKGRPAKFEKVPASSRFAAASRAACAKCRATGASV